jgi:hypothetical protein
VTLHELQQDILPELSRRELLEALLSLQKRSLIEQQSGNYTQQPVVREYITDKLLGQFCCEMPAAIFESFRD